MPEMTNQPVEPAGGIFAWFDQYGDPCGAKVRYAQAQAMAAGLNAAGGAAAYDVESQIQNRQWETGDDMPDPSEVDRD